MEPKTCSECDYCAYSWFYKRWVCDAMEDDDERSILQNDIYRTVSDKCPLSRNRIEK